ncbi:helix-turn-helix domain-containing protein [Sporosarcina obsidiansis]|uniref:helix-turn-helix domain-containing protein n=1 Tax=Sporosarcina obsidiansis TaxID=2660748 RepID=UPI00129A599F|nr:helix-turn-helix transcriptional regulator [Sporosarcina obsidiansis]
MGYGAILRACRKRKGWTQEDLAEALHIEQADISRIENDRKEPLMSLVQKWTAATNSTDVMVAFITGMEGMAILTNILAAAGTGIIGGFINFLL